MTSDDNTAKDHERRQSERSFIANTLFIKSISSSQITSFDHDIKTVSTVNASARGLQVIIDFEVLQGADIALWILGEGRDQPRTLINGNVRWVNKTAGDHKYLIGIELDEASVPSLGEWLDQQP